MKLILSTLAALALMMISQTAYAWSESVEGDHPDDAYYYEITYSQCVFKYEQSEHSDAAIACVCHLLANHAVAWRDHGESAPSVSESEERRCLRR